MDADGGNQIQEEQNLSNRSKVGIDGESLRQYIRASNFVRWLDTAIAIQFNADIGELREFNIVSLVKFLEDLEVNSIAELDGGLQDNGERILSVANIEQNSFKTKIPTGFSLLIMCYILAAERLKSEQALTAWLDDHFTGHSVDQRSFARRLLSTTGGACKSDKEGSEYKC